MICVLAAGRVAEQGTHATLMKAGGEYFRLFTLQSSGYQEPNGNGNGNGNGTQADGAVRAMRLPGAPLRRPEQ
jgi:ATP-binding cassette subfamily B protein